MDWKRETVDAVIGVCPEELVLLLNELTAFVASHEYFADDALAKRYPQHIG